jgi:hypothetical protein
MWIQGFIARKDVYSKVDEECDEVSDIGNKMARIIELNKISYTELIHSVDVTASYAKIAFDIVKNIQEQGSS